MGVYIKMEMPENCALCPVWDAGNCLVATEAVICEYTKRPFDCPLVPVPPHGRLIDADDFIKRIEGLVHQAKADGYDFGAAWYTAFIRHIELAPTIIEAEEGE